jgi:flagellar hook-associated protein 1 FlgK
MSGLYNTINIGLSGLLALRQALDVHAHNLANATTEGYRRQEAILRAVPGLPPPGNMNALLGGQWGAGVWAAWPRHSHESFLDLQARITDASLGRWSSVSTMLHQVETILQPAPGDDLGAQLDRFWNAWEAVAVQPEDLGIRYALRQQAVALTDAFRDAHSRLQSIRTTADTSLSTRIDEVNSITAEVAELNRVIAVALAESRAPNDDLDRRDLLLNRLAELTGAMPFTGEEGHLIVYLDGRPIIQGSSAHQLSFASTAGGVEIRNSYDDGLTSITNGEIGGLLEARDVSLPTYIDQLNTLASTLIAEVNALHQTGFGLDDNTGRDFFVPGGEAGTIALDPAILADVQAIAAAAGPGVPGDGSVALQIAGLRSASVISGRTLVGYAHALLGLIGSDARAADSTISAYRSAREQIRVQEQSVSGVSTDEELAYLMQCQRAYEAAAQVIQVGDEMLRTVIERLGVR